MSDVDRRFGSWLELVSELLATPGTGDFPRAVLEAALIMTFGCQVSWNWRHRDGTAGFELARRPDLTALAPAMLEQWDAVGGPDHHPLLCWFAHTGDSTAMTVGRVPPSVACAEGAALLHELLSPYGCEQQLALPVRVAGVEHHAFVLARGSEDFSEEDLALARRIQPLLQVLDRQACVLDERRVSTTPSLTGRELAILHLLADGLTAAAIGRRLGVSPRTVQKHLENLYRKLGVRDRLQAVLAAQEAALLEPPPRRAAGVLVGGPYAS